MAIEPDDTNMRNGLAGLGALLAFFGVYDFGQLRSALDGSSAKLGLPRGLL
jgi:hypothetical protein